MTISKLSPLLGAVVVGVFCLAARAEDNEAQAAARMALAKSLFAEQATNAASADTNVVMYPVNDKEAAKAAKAKVKADKAAAEAKAKQDAAQAKADQKAQAEADKQRQSQQAADATQADAKAKADKLAEDSAAKSQADQKSQAESAALAAALQATNNASAMTNTWASAPATNAQPAADAKDVQNEKPAPPPPPAPATATANTNYAGSDLGMKPMAPPPLPISSSKADRLQALLDKYKADQITPEEYHQQRAAILAEP